MKNEALYSLSIAFAFAGLIGIVVYFLLGKTKLGQIASSIFEREYLRILVFIVFCVMISAPSYYIREKMIIRESIRGSAMGISIGCAIYIIKHKR